MFLFVYILEYVNDLKSPSQLTFTCSRLTIKALEKGVKYAQK